jgi:hypothetical protein
MKSRLLSAALLTIAALMIASAAFAAPAAPVGTPFKGSWNSHEVDTFVPAPPPDATTMYVDLDGWGNATHLGKYTAHFEAIVDVAGCGCSVDDRTTLTAANGDKLYAVGHAQGELVPGQPTYRYVTHYSTITGGTGRFAGATGSFVVKRLADLATGVSHGSFDGTIVLAPGK